MARAWKLGSSSSDKSRDVSGSSDHHFQESDALLSFEPHDRGLSNESDIGALMWTKDYIGLYTHYAITGLLLGMAGLNLNFCVYVYGGPSNVCANAGNMIQLAWSFKIFYAFFTDSFQPWGMRRKPYMVIGWALTLMMMLILSFSASAINVSAWIGLNMAMHAFAMIGDVQADGYLVEIGQMESTEKRGQVLATGFLIRFVFILVAGLVQTLFVNGRSTNAPSCHIGWSSCWSFGLTIEEYYGLMFVLSSILLVPILFLKEPDGSHIPKRSTVEFLLELWDTLQSLTSFCLIIYCIGMALVAQLVNRAAVYMEYYIIKLTSAQAGIDVMTSAFAVMGGIWIFKTHLIHRNWRHTNYLSCVVTTFLNFLWILVYYDVGGLRNPWFAIFIDLDTSFTSGLTNVLFSMAIIEIAKSGQEASTFELLVSISNAAWTLSGILSTQLLVPLRASGCHKEHCPSNTVNLNSVKAFEASRGPARFTAYTFLIVGLGLGGVYLFTRFLPRNKDECHFWNRIGKISDNRAWRGTVGMFLGGVVLLYGIIASIILLDSRRSCMKFVGGSGC